MVYLTDEQAQAVIEALSAVARDEMRFAAWDIMDAAIKAKPLPEYDSQEYWLRRSEHTCAD